MKNLAGLRELSKQRFQQLVDEAPGTFASQARAAGASPSSWSALKTGKMEPLRSDGALRLAAQKFCEFHGVGPAYVWPELDQLHLGEDTDRYPSAVDLDADMLLKQRTRLIARSLAALTPREEEVLRARFFQDLRLPEVGALLRPEAPYSRERIRNIEAQAIGKLRFKNRPLSRYQQPQIALYPYTCEPPPPPLWRFSRGRLLLRDFALPDRKRGSKGQIRYPSYPRYQNRYSPAEPPRHLPVFGDVDIRVEPGGIPIEDEYRQASPRWREEILEKLQGAAERVDVGPIYSGLCWMIRKLEKLDFPDVFPLEHQGPRTIVIKPVYPRFV